MACSSSSTTTRAMSARGLGRGNTCAGTRPTRTPASSRWAGPAGSTRSCACTTASSGVWTISKPLPYDLHLAGSGTMVVNVTTTVPNANLAVDVYDLDASGTGPLITRQGHLARTPGDSAIRLELWSADWKLAAGHRIGVRVTDNNQDWWWLAAPSAK